MIEYREMCGDVVGLFSEETPLHLVVNAAYSSAIAKGLKGIDVSEYISMFIESYIEDYPSMKLRFRNGDLVFKPKYPESKEWWD